MTICVAYLILKYKYSYEEAYQKVENLIILNNMCYDYQVRKARPVASPNMGFIVQLIMYHKRLQYSFDALPGPRIFCIGSHQKETPHLIVSRMVINQLMSKIYFTFNNFVAYGTSLWDEKY